MFLEFYGLNEQPFGVTPDPRFLYMGRPYSEALPTLVHGIETGCGFMALIAAPGMGKTTLLLRLMETLRDSALTAFLFQTHTNSEGFLRDLLRDLDVEPSGRDLSDLQRQLRDVLMRGSESGKRVVMVIDEAQNLDDSLLEMIRMLSNFETPQAKLLQIVLVGQPVLAEKLSRPNLTQLRQRVSIIAHLSPLRGDEVENYIRHRLRVAGYKGETLFTPGAMALIARHGAGAPRVINNLCFNALSLGYARGQKRIGESILGEVVAGLDLESLRENCRSGVPSAAQPAPPRRDVMGEPEDSMGRSRAAAPEADDRAQDLRSGFAFLDSVNLSDSPSDRTAKIRRAARGSAPGGSDGGRRSRRRLGALALWTIAGVLVGIGIAPRLRVSWGFLARAAGIEPVVPATGGRLSDNVRPGNPPPGPVSQPDGRLNPGDPLADTSQSGNSSQKAVIAPAEAGSAGDSAVLAENPRPAVLHSSRESRRPAAFSDDVDSVDGTGGQGVRGKLIVQSSVSGARISLNGRSDPKWVTPHLFSLPAGTYIVSVSDGGYKTSTRRLHVDEGREEWVTIGLRPDQGTGVFIVDTNPPGMPVFIDGRRYGVSHMETVLNSGWHVCEVFPGQGYSPLRSQFHLSRGEILTKRLLIPSVSPPGRGTTELPGAQTRIR